MKPNRRRLQYSLRSLLIFVLAANAGMAWFGARYRAAKQQREAVAGIRALGGEVFYDYEQEAWRGTVAPPGPAWARRLLGVDFFADVVGVCPGILPTLSHSCPPITDEWLEQIGKLSRLEGLDLTLWSGLSDAKLARLERLARLKTLRLDGYWVTDAGLAHLRGLTRLEELDLNGCRVTDAGLRHLRGLTRLRTLNLDQTGVTDAGLEHLRGLKELRTLNLNCTDVTDEGAKKLQRALPKCEIRR